MVSPHLFMAFHFMPHGSVEDLLIRKQMFPISPGLSKYELLNNLRLVTQMLVDACSGLLHCHAKRVIHRDVSSRNFLVDPYHRVTISDFGMSQCLPLGQDRGQRDQGEMLPVKWAAPESLVHGTYSTKSDLFAFGVFMFEVAARTDPYPGVSPIEVGAWVSDAQRQLRPSIPGSCPREWAELMRHCWAHEPDQRPPMIEVHNDLVTFLESVRSLGDNIENVDRVYHPLDIVCSSSAIRSNHVPMTFPVSVQYIHKKANGIRSRGSTELSRGGHYMLMSDN